MTTKKATKSTADKTPATTGKAQRAPKLITRAPKSEQKTPKATSKSGIALRLCQRETGATLEQVAEALSKTGSQVTPAYARSWVSYLNDQHGFGLRSEIDGKGRLKVWAYSNQETPKAKKRPARTRKPKAAAPDAPAATPAPAPATEQPQATAAN